MPEPVTLTKGEFDKFWDEVLGRSWYIEEWDVNDEEYDQGRDDHVMTIGMLTVSWNRKGEPETNGYMTSSRLASYDHLPVLRSWIDKQEMRKVSAWIPSQHVHEFDAFVERVGGQK